jgi:hypothetical protein
LGFEVSFLKRVAAPHKPGPLFVKKKRLSVAGCVCCGTETILHLNKTPVCVHCAHLTPATRTVRAKLFHGWREAVKKADTANDALMEVTGRAPSGNPHRDPQRINDVSQQLSVARQEMITAHNRLNAFLEHHIVPDDLQV